MNEALRLISKSLKPFGYHVRKFQAPNLLKINNLESGEDNTQNITAPRLSMDKPYWTQDADLSRMVIYVRTCIRANRNIDTTARITQVNLEEHTLRCLRSLVRSVNHALSHNQDRSIELILLDDRSDAEPLTNLEKELKALHCPYTVETTKETGQGNSLHQQFAEGAQQNTLTYFIEDDYLHEENAIDVLWNFYTQITQQLHTHTLLYPQEHPVLYTDHYPSYILLGPDRHWRSIRHATHSFLTHGHVVRDFWNCFENTKYVGIKKKRKLGSEARTTNKLFHHIPAFSPMKPAAIHLQFEDTVPPLYDWRGLWEGMEG